MCRIHTEIYDCGKHTHSMNHRPCERRNDEDYPCKSLRISSSTKGNCPECNPSKDVLDSVMEQLAVKNGGELQVCQRESPNTVSRESQIPQRTKSPTQDGVQRSETPVSGPSTKFPLPADESDLPQHRRDLFKALQAADKESNKKLAEYLKAAENDSDEGLTDEQLTEYLNAASAAEKIREEFERLTRDLWDFANPASTQVHPPSTRTHHFKHQQKMCRQYPTPFEWWISDPNSTSEEGLAITAQVCGHVCVIEWNRCLRYQARLENPFLEPCAEEASPEAMVLELCPRCELEMSIQRLREAQVIDELLWELRERERQGIMVVVQREDFEIYEDDSDANSAVEVADVRADTDGDGAAADEVQIAGILIDLDDAAMNVIGGGVEDGPAASEAEEEGPWGR
ncbi:hypothetical protein MMC30_005450 [Trapelia coarctata]|nr:hypothetical protein [Trapelia coarctata]